MHFIDLEKQRWDELDVVVSAFVAEGADADADSIGHDSRKKRHLKARYMVGALLCKGVDIYLLRTPLEEEGNKERDPTASEGRGAALVRCKDYILNSRLFRNA